MTKKKKTLEQPEENEASESAEIKRRQAEHKEKHVRAAEMDIF
jgi:hypothetical protein